MFGFILWFYSSFSNSGVVDLKDCQQVKRSSNVKNHKNVFDIVTTERVYHMSADSAAEKQEWVEALHGILSNDEEVNELDCVFGNV